MWVPSGLDQPIIHGGGRLGCVPTKTIPYREWKVVKYHRWLRGLTATQYFGVMVAQTLPIVAALVALLWWVVPRSWVPHSLPVWILVGLAVVLSGGVTGTLQR
jgi:hypothetical protein